MKQIKPLKNIWNTLEHIKSENDLLNSQINISLEEDFRELNVSNIDDNDLINCISNIEHIISELSHVLNHPTKQQEVMIEQLIELSIHDRLNIEKNKLKTELEKLEEEEELQLDISEENSNKNYTEILNNIKNIRPDVYNSTIKNNPN